MWLAGAPAEQRLDQSPEISGTCSQEYLQWAAVEGNHRQTGVARNLLLSTKLDMRFHRLHVADFVCMSAVDILSIAEAGWFP